MARLRKSKGEKPKVTSLAEKSSTKVKDAKKSSTPKSKSSKPSKKDELKQNVLALGGTLDDLDLVNGSGSGDGGEFKDDGKVDASLQGDISKFMKELNFGTPSGEAKKPEPAVSPQAKSKKARKEKNANNGTKGKEVKKDAGSPKEKVEGKEKKDSKEKGTKKEKKDNSKKSKPTETPKPSTSNSKPSEAPAPSADSTPAPPISTSQFLPPKSAKLIVQPTPDWYTVAPPLPTTSKPIPTPTSSQISTLTERAAKLHAAEMTQFSSAPHASLVSSSSDQAFLKNILASGTLSDRLSALTLMVQSSPLHNIRGLEVLKGMAEKGRGGGAPSKDGPKGRGGGREERLKAARAIADWWIGGGAPERKLKYFHDQPLLHPGVTDQHLVVWYFEDWLKKYFFSLLQILEVLSLDPLAYVRTQTLTLIYNLLKEKPEQEHNLLRLLVNKLGDTEKSVCSRASYHILQLLQAHPVMKSIVIRETTALIMRPTGAGATSSLTNTHNSSSSSASVAKPKIHIKFDDEAGAKSSAPPVRPLDRSTWNMHARYYASITFNQIVLSTSEEDRKAARALMDVYFQMFREVVGERSVADEAHVDEEEEEDVVEGAGGKDKGRYRNRKFDKGKAKVKEIQGAAGFAEVQDENSRLVSAILTGVNRAMPFARFGGADVEFQRHMDTLFLITHTSTFNITLQALTLIHHVISSVTTSSQSEASSSSSQALAARYYRTLYATLLDPRLYTSAKQAMYLNLLFKSLKSDPDTERVKAFVKRLCQVLAGGFGGTEFVAGGLWLLGELFDGVPGLRSIMEKAPASPITEGEQQETYDPRKRDPQYAHASSSPLWELTPLLNHAHPTLTLLARQLLAHQPLTTSPDLALHTLTHFLDRFVYKNPKKLKSKGSSAMQPAAAPEGEGVKRVRGEVQEGPVNEEGWWKRSAGSVPADQLFYHKFFSQKHEKELAKAAKADKRKGKRDGSDDEEESDQEDAAAEDNEDDEEDADEKDGEDEEEDSDAEEAEIWKAMKASMPQVDDAEDDDLMVDSDELPSGLDMDDSDDDGVAEDEDDDASAGDSHKVDSEEDDVNDDAFSLVEGSDAEDLVDLDDDVPQGLIEFPGPEGEANAEEEWTGFGGDPNAGGKRKRGKEDGKEKRKKLRSLPTFASYEDYAKMIEDGPEDNV